MASLDPKELLLVQKFRSRVTDVVPVENLRDDYWLIRWIRARDLDLEKAEIMLRKSMAWAKRNEVDSILRWKPVHNYYRYANLGVDKDGSPVFICPMGLWDMREHVDVGDIVPAFRATLRLLGDMEEAIKASAKRLSRPVSQIVAIFDFQQFSYRQLNSRTVCQGAIELFRIFEANHPEILKHCFFINTPRIFPVFFAILKPFLSARTLSKLEFFGPNKTKWIQAVRQKIPAEILPPYYGGTRRGTDEYCSQEDIWNNGPLPPNFYGSDMSRGRNSVAEDPALNSEHFRQGVGKRVSMFESGALDLKMAEIPAGSKMELEFPVSKSKFETENPATLILLKWRIKSEGYDIGFQVTFKDEFGSPLEALVDNHRIQSHLTQQDGSLVCERPGTYIATFDNTYSKHRKKVIYYSVIIMEDFDLANQLITNN